MPSTVACPYCGQTRLVPDDAGHDIVKCGQCGHPFATMKADSIWKTAAVFDGAVSGILAGILAGVLVGMIVGGYESGISGAVAGVFFGLIIGFAIGTPSGMAVGVAGKLLSPSVVKPSRTAVLVGICAGGFVAGVIGHLVWILPGAVLGTGGASLWPMFRRRMIW